MGFHTFMLDCKTEKTPSVYEVMGLRKLILSTLTAWARNRKNGPQDAHFEHFGGLGPDEARMGLRKLILTTLAVWAQI